jgi:hypothetical protein
MTNEFMKFFVSASFWEAVVLLGLFNTMRYRMMKLHHRVLIITTVSLAIGASSAFASTVQNPINPYGVVQTVIVPAPLIRMNFTTQLPNSNQNSMNSKSTQWALNANNTKMQLSNGQNYFTVPYTGNWYSYFDAQTVNNNGGSGEWNTIKAEIYSNNKAAAICNMEIDQQGGGGSNGGGYVYYNYKNCGPTALSQGDQLSVWYQITNTGTGTAAVGLITSSVSISTFAP